MAESYRQALDTPICEKTTALIKLLLTDEADQLLAPGAIDTCTLTLYERESETIINGRNGSNIKNANGGTIDTEGLALVLANADNALVDPNINHEVHIALIQWTWSSSTKAGAKELRLTVFNQAKIS